jgi:hypothetical protein
VADLEARPPHPLARVHALGFVNEALRSAVVARCDGLASDVKAPSGFIAVDRSHRGSRGWLMLLNCSCKHRRGGVETLDMHVSHNVKIT